MNIKLKSIHLENFKGVISQDIQFGDKVSIKGANAVGKTTIVDAFTWLLFNKDSHGVEKFEVRPLDKEGNRINYIDIKVSAVIDIDGNESELSKTQKQNWVKQRGTENAIFKGNVNEFSIDGYPKSEKEYKEFINGIISEDMFKILTNPTFFPAMKWKEQRDILMKFANTKSDFELATELGGYELILSELEKAPSTEDILNKYKKSKKELENDLKEIPVRIDELSKQVVSIDLAELELKKKALEEKSGSEKQILKTIDDLKNEIFELNFKISDYTRNQNADLINERSSLDNDLLSAQTSLQKKKSELSSLEIKKLQAESEKKTKSEESANLGLKYKSIKDEVFDESAWIFDESAKTCVRCGQILPKSQIDNLVADFEKRKAESLDTFNNGKKARLEQLIERGNALKTIIDAKTNEIAELDKEISTAKELVISLETNVNELSTKLSSLPERVDLSSDAGFIELTSKKEDAERHIEELKASINPVENTSIDYEIREIEKQIASVTNNEQIENRISELKAEQLEVAQKVATCEHFIFKVEEFIKAKLETITTSINSKFELVTFSLFDVAINGGISETCECCVNGVPYSDVNSASKTQAGIDIINTLSEHYDTYLPVFIDNRESCTWIPEMKSQTISLYVDPNEKVLKVE